MTIATNIGIVYDSVSGQILRILNPDFETEIDAHHLNAGETMIRVAKSDYGVSYTSNMMTIQQVAAIINTLNPTLLLSPK